MEYAWAANRSKLERAKGELGPDATEAALKERYIAMAGLVLNDDGTVVVEKMEKAEEPKKTETPVAEEPKPKKAKKK